MSSPKFKSWQEKLNDSKDLPKVMKVPPKLAKKWGEGILVIPAPIEVNEIMKKVPKGKLLTINDIRQELAKTHKATIACPITTGIFSWISAHAAEEAKVQGERDITPYWRTLKTGGILNEKYPGGAENQAKLLKKEGHDVIRKGKNYVVINYEQALVK